MSTHTLLSDSILLLLNSHGLNNPPAGPPHTARLIKNTRNRLRIVDVDLVADALLDRA